MNSLFLRVIRQWIPIAVGLSAVAFIISMVIQQDIRMEGNDPQIQMAEDLATQLNNGAKPTVDEKIDIAKSLSPFTVIYDKNKNLMSTNATINGNQPQFPKDALTAHKGSDILGENRVTWQPQDGVRLATVVVVYNNGFVVVGRNMRELEARVEHQFTNIFIGWIISLIATLSAVVFMQTVLKKK